MRFGKRISKTILSLILVFALSFSVSFADFYDGEEPSSLYSVTSADTAAPSEQPETVEQTAPEQSSEPEQPISHIIKKGKYYYYLNDDGTIRKDAGFVTDLGNRYYIRKGGKIRTSKSFKVKKKYYRANKKGVILTGVYKWGKNYCYSNDVGQWKRSEGFVSWNGDTYYVQKRGAIIIDNGFSVKNTPYAADKSGHITKLDIPGDNGNAVVKLAKKQVGIMTGKKYWRALYGSRFIDTDRTPWCATFVAWCFKKAGKYKKISGVRRYGALGFVPSYTRYANKHKKWIKRKKAKGGDLIIFRHSHHIGIVEGRVGKYIITIEGNSGPTAAYGCRKPGAVTRKVYKINSKEITGIMRVM